MTEQQTASPPAPAPETGVYFARADYLGLVRRVLIDVTDLVVFSLLYYVAVLVLDQFRLPVIAHDQTQFVILLALLVGYFVVLKSYGRSVGYLLLRARLERMEGGRPGLGANAIRALFLLLGPLNILLDILWLTSDADRQAIRDKFARTYVVRATAKPVGQGRIRYARVDLMGWTLLLPEVVRAEAAARAPAAVSR